jgi:hypothetical protein
MRDEKQIYPRMRRINANHVLSLGFFRVCSRDSRASLFVLRHTNCVRKNLIRWLPDASPIYMSESYDSCCPRNPWFQMFCSLGIGIWTF